MTTFGMLLFDDAEELDFVGPWEVITASSMLRARAGHPADIVVTIAERPGPIRCAKGLRVVPDHTLDDHPPLDVLLVPGGMGTRREVSNAKVIGWIDATARDSSWVTGVCTGSLLLHEAGPARGRRVATYWGFEDEVRKSGVHVAGEALHPITSATTVRVRDGKTLTTDGPFAETREHLGGFYLIDAKDLDDAIQWAAKIPTAASGSVEVRPVVLFET